ncbi:MAG: type II secretion system protein, partial [Pseudomonadota bacterium]
MSSRVQTGFSLLELTVVLIVVSTLLSGLVMPLSAARERQDRAAQKAQLLDIESALLGHLLARGRLPCAATSASRGEEAASATGCAAYAGFVPVVALGLRGPLDTAGRLLDPWHRPIRYRVSASDSNADGLADYVVTDGVLLQSPLEVHADNQVLHAVDAGCGATELRASGLVVVLVSEGPQTARSQAEAENLNGDGKFVSRPLSDTGACAFD